MKLSLISVLPLFPFLLALVNSPVSRPCEVLQPGCVCQLFFFFPAAIRQPLPDFIPSTSRRWRLGNKQRDWLILMDLTPNTYPGLSGNLEIPKLKITLS